jgi:hypothetical protein
VYWRIIIKYYSITTADAHTSAASSRLNWRPRRFKWTRPFRRKTKSDFCACVITFQLASISTAEMLLFDLFCLAPMDCSPVLYFPEPLFSWARALRTSLTLSTDTGGNLGAHVLICVMYLSTLWRRIGEQRHSSTYRHYMEMLCPISVPSRCNPANESPVPVQYEAAFVFRCVCLSVFHEINNCSDMEWTDVIYVKWFYFELKFVSFCVLFV